MPFQSIYKRTATDAGILYAWFPAMHSRTDIILYGSSDENTFKYVVDQLVEEINRIEKLANFFDCESALYKINSSASDNPVIVDGELINIISDCISYKEKTNGYFDISIQSSDYSVDTSSYIEISKADSTLFFKKKGIKIDLSGYIKGYTLDMLKEILIRNSVENVLINMGNSSVLALGNHPHGKGWKIAGKDTGKDYLLHNECLTTSGNENNGRKHIVNPVTGKFIEGSGQLSVITSGGAEGEVLSTAIFAAEPSQRAILKKRFNVITYPN